MTLVNIYLPLNYFVASDTHHGPFRVSHLLMSFGTTGIWDHDIWNPDKILINNRPRLERVNTFAYFE